jgi:Na+-translocating ferredoxin:NAD+ oxidoreductase subunit G
VTRNSSFAWLCAVLALCGIQSLAAAETNQPATLTIDALKAVLPAFTNDPARDAAVITEKERTWTFFRARRNNSYVGCAVQASAPGYAGPVQVLVGILPDGSIRSMEVTRADRETANLGTRIREPKFKDQFKGRSSADRTWSAVTKDGGEIHAVTGATVSSRAAAQAVKAALDVYAAHAAEITGKP